MLCRNVIIRTWYHFYYFRYSKKYQAFHTHNALFRFSCLPSFDTTNSFAILISALIYYITFTTHYEVRRQPVPEPKWRIKEKFVTLWTTSLPPCLHMWVTNWSTRHIKCRAKTIVQQMLGTRLVKRRENITLLLVSQLPLPHSRDFSSTIDVLWLLRGLATCCYSQLLSSSLPVDNIWKSKDLFILRLYNSFFFHFVSSSCFPLSLPITRGAI